MASLPSDESMLIEALVEASPSDWPSQVSEALGVPVHIAAEKIGQFMERYVTVLLTYRTLVEIAGSMARLAALQEQRRRQQDIAERHHAKVKAVVTREARSRNFVATDDAEEDAEDERHLAVLKDGLREQGGASYNLAKLMREERDEATHHARLLDRLQREMDGAATLSKNDRTRYIHRLALEEGRFPEAIRALSMLPAEGTQAPTKGAMLDLASRLIDRLDVD